MCIASLTSMTLSTPSTEQKSNSSVQKPDKISTLWNDTMTFSDIIRLMRQTRPVIFDITQKNSFLGVSEDEIFSRIKKLYEEKHFKISFELVEQLTEKGTGRKIQECNSHIHLLCKTYLKTKDYTMALTLALSASHPADSSNCSYRRYCLQSIAKTIAQDSNIPEEERFSQAVEIADLIVDGSPNIANSVEASKNGAYISIIEELVKVKKIDKALELAQHFANEYPTLYFPIIFAIAIVQEDKESLTRMLDEHAKSLEGKDLFKRQISSFATEYPIKGSFSEIEKKLSQEFIVTIRSE
jgi:hypothetical protein